MMKINGIDVSKVELIAALNKIVQEAAFMKNAYFFTPCGNASGRRSYEKWHSVPEITWTEGNNTYSAEFITKCSCKNVYASGIYTKNGNKTTLTTIKNSLKRLEGSAK